MEYKKLLKEGLPDLKLSATSIANVIAVCKFLSDRQNDCVRGSRQDVRDRID